jgi:hypothetical protein
MPIARHLWLPLLAVGCAPTDPLRAIPAHERVMLQAEARMAAPADRRSTVAAMLERARGPGPAPLLLRFEGDATQPDTAQRTALARFTEAARGAPRLVVAARPGLGADAMMLGPRRAIAVARLLEAEGREVEMRFDTAMPVDQVRVLLPEVTLPGARP